MTTKLDEVIQAAMQLGIEERAHVVGRLLLSLDEPSASELERLWLEEADRRLREFREGRVNGIPSEEVFRRSMDDMS
ncbi:MAG: addiction module protein [Pseudomonadota bacterium]